MYRICANVLYKSGAVKSFVAGEGRTVEIMSNMSAVYRVSSVKTNET